MPVSNPIKTWPFSRDVNMREELIRSFLDNPDTSDKGNPAALPSTLMDFGFWSEYASAPTPVGAMLKDGRLTWKETVLVQLSKRPSSRDAVNIKPLVVVCKFLNALKDAGLEPSLRKADIQPLSLVEKYEDLTKACVTKIYKARSSGGALHTYCDIWLNSLSETGLFEVVRSETGRRDKLVISSSEGAAEIVSFIAINGVNISSTPPKLSDAESRERFYAYMGSDHTGLFEILPPKAFSRYYPNLTKISGSEDVSQLVIHREPFEDNLNLDQLAQELKKMNEDSDTGVVAYHMLGLKYPKSLSEAGVANVLQKAGLQDSFVTEINKGRRLHKVIAAKKWGLSFEDSNKNVAHPEDILTTALKLFEEKRALPLGGWGSYDQWTKAVRTEFVKVDPGFVDNPDFKYTEYLRRFTVSYFVFNMFFYKHTVEEQKAVLAYLQHEYQAPHPASWYLNNENRLVVGGKAVGGMAPRAILYFMNELHPQEFVAWTDVTYSALEFLGLHKGPAPQEETVANYEDCKVKQGIILAKMRDLKIGIATDDDTPADYRTVNEFTWWLAQDENKDLVKDKIREEVMKNEFRTVESKPKEGGRTLKEAVADDDMMQRLMAALRTKPFAILAGHSGTGKSQLVRRLAYMTCNDEVLYNEKNKFNAPGNYCMVQVKPNWHDSTDLLGYYTEMGGGHYHTTAFVEFICKAYAYPNTPFFVCLDEMNLAPVEQYFAEFLSAIESYSAKTKLTDRLINENAPAEQVCGQTKLIESRKQVEGSGLTIPRNLFVVGTVNVDETTCQFSRKVLDRAMTLLMTAVSFDSMTKENDPSAEPLLDPDGIKFFLERPTQATLVQGQMDWLKKVQEQVGDTAFAIAYRFANECALYQAAYQKLMGVKEDANDAGAQKTAIDHTVLMKLLPRIHGTEDEVTALFKGRESEPKKDGLIKALGEGQSVNMMNDILKRGGDYISFWP